CRGRRRRDGRRLLLRRLALRDGADDRREERRVEIRRALVRGGPDAALQRRERRLPALGHRVPCAAGVAGGVLELRDRCEGLHHDACRLVGVCAAWSVALLTPLLRWTVATS